jgi:hypothetical protein
MMLILVQFMLCLAMILMTEMVLKIMLMLMVGRSIIAPMDLESAMIIEAMLTARYKARISDRIGSNPSWKI